MRDYPLENVVMPMGGTSVKDPNKLEKLMQDPSYIAEEKMDGIRQLSIGGRFFGRNLAKADGLPVEKTANIPHLHEILKQYPNLILDGELYFPGKNSNAVTEITGCLPEKAIERQAKSGYLSYCIYDILRDGEGNWLIDLPWKIRRAHLERVFTALFSESPYVEISQYTSSPQKKSELLQQVLDSGGEGIMLKNIEGKYTPDKKPRWNWVKVKREITSDVVITGFKPPVKEYTGKEIEQWRYWEDSDGNLHELSGGSKEAEELANAIKTAITPVTKYYFNSWIGAIEFAQYTAAGELLPVGFCSGFPENVRKKMSTEPNEFIGTCLEIMAHVRTKDLKFKHPQFKRLRPDKSPKDCVVGVD
ncbi:hypothetical protein BACPU_25990 [Bacillus pumilus]|nr:hypothetical protein BACPU_25990 [Bacillus pumilus]